MPPIPVWLIKWIGGLVIDWLIKRVGHTAAADHFEAELAKRAPLPPDITPNEARNPNLAHHYEG
jgi:hypothetical protein